MQNVIINMKLQIPKTLITGTNRNKGAQADQVEEIFLSVSDDPH